eukprot:6209747-Pleurochrysis_carterae.AAC.3
MFPLRDHTGREKGNMMLSGTVVNVNGYDHCDNCGGDGGGEDSAYDIDSNIVVQVMTKIVMCV